mmetsp:Transcript_4615/g.14825  ORF Transcript_4615/g.14825 Transcript_4615/m.14825 type:complete len:356 (-) Transcript_4615:337-1404(-)
MSDTSDRASKRERMRARQVDEQANKQAGKRAGGKAGGRARVGRLAHCGARPRASPRLDDAVRIELRPHPLLECLGAVHHLELCVGDQAGLLPAPLAEDLAPLRELIGHLAALVRALLQVPALVPPASKDGARLLVLESGLGPVTADVALGGLQVVETGHGEIKVRFTLSAVWAAHRAHVLLHGDDRPIGVYSLRVLDKKALPTSMLPVVSVPATLIAVCKHFGRELGRRTRKPDLLSVFGAAVVIWVLGCVARSGNVLRWVPWLERLGVTRLAVAVPIMRQRHARLPLSGGLAAAVAGILLALGVALLVAAVLLVVVFIGLLVGALAARPVTPGRISVAPLALFRVVTVLPRLGR